MDGCYKAEMIKMLLNELKDFPFKTREEIDDEFDVSAPCEIKDTIFDLICFVEDVRSIIECEGVCLDDETRI